MSEYCQACKDEIEGLRASVEHRCASKKRPVRMKRLGWTLPNSPVQVWTRDRRLRNAWLEAEWQVEAIYVRDKGPL